MPGHQGGVHGTLSVGFRPSRDFPNDEVQGPEGKLRTKVSAQDNHSCGVW